MKKIIAILLMASMGWLGSTAHAQDYRIEHMEPPFWWSGMQHKKLQLMVHGKQIADLEPTVSYPGVRIDAITRVANRNYLFVDLILDDSAKAGEFDIRFKRGNTLVNYRYQLRSRETGSAQRKGFSSADAIYQVMPDRFANGNPDNDSTVGLDEKSNRAAGSGRHGGDLQGLREHLDYIAAMGFTQLWPTPLVESNMPVQSYHGYATTDHYQIDARYGSNEGFRQLVASAKAKGIGVIQDVVLNHIGSKHWWMTDMPMPDWINHDGKFVPTAHHRTAVQSPYASDEDRQNFTTGWFNASMPDLNQTKAQVANYLIQNTIWWIEYAGLSGLRVDTYGYSDGAFLTEWSRRILDEYPNLTMVGEEWSNLPPVVAHWQKGKLNHDGYLSSMPSMMDFPINATLRKALTATEGHNAGFNDLYEMLSLDDLYPNAGELVLFEGNHDMARIFSVLGEDDDLFKMALAYVLTAPRIPQLYYGTEILMTSTTVGRDDSSYRHDFPGGWVGDKVNAFTGAGLSPQQLASQAFLKRLLNWRKSQPLIHHGKTMQYGPEQGTYVYFRYEGDKKIMVAFNKNAQPSVLDTRRFHEMLTGVASGLDVITGNTFTVTDKLTLPARSVLVLELQRPTTPARP